MKPSPTQMRALLALRSGPLPRWKLMRDIGRSGISTIRALERRGLVWILWRLQPRRSHVRLTWRGEYAIRQS